jgi:hypothetical protein
VIGVPLTFSVIRKVVVFVRVLTTSTFGVSENTHGGSGIVNWWIPETEILKLQKSGQFPDESVRITV